MRLESNNMVSWEYMKDTIVEKYRDYCKANNNRDEIFRIVQWENESLEYFEERFQLSYKWDHNCSIDDKSLKHVLLWGVRYEHIDRPNILVNEDIY